MLKRFSSDSAPWAQALVDHRRQVIVIGVLLCVATAWGLTRIQLDSDIVPLLPAEDPAVRAYLKSQELFSAESVVFMLESQDGEIDPGLARRLAEIARRHEVFRRVDALPFSGGGLEPFFDRSLQLVPAERREELLERLSPAGMDEAAHLLRGRLSSAMAGAATDLMRRDPLGLMSLMDLAGPAGSFNWRLEDGAMLSADRQALLVFAELHRPGHDEALLRALDESQRLIDAELRAELVQDGIATDRLRLRATGAAVIAAEEAKLLERETRNSFLLSLLLVVVLFAAAFRRPGAFLWLALPLGGAVGLTLVLGQLFFGRLSLLSASAAVMMVGLGVDFGIHLYTRALDRRRQGLEADAAMVAALREVTGANLLAAATSGLAFATLALSAIPGVRQTGLLTALGLAVCFVAMTCFFPALLLASRALEGGLAEVPGRYLEPWLKLISRHSKKAMAILAAVTLLALLWVPRVEFTGSSYGLRVEVNPALGTQEDLMRRFGSHFRASVALLEGDEPAALEEANRRLLEAANTLVREGHLATVVSPASWIPSAAEQLETLRQAQERFSATATVERLAESLRGAGLAPQGFAEGLESLRRSLERREALGLEAMLEESALAPMVERFWRRQGERIYGALLFLPTDQRYQEGGFEVIDRAFRAVELPAGVRATVVTPRLLTDTLRDAAQHEIGPAVGLALLAIAAIRGIYLSVENIAAVPLILGIGIDDALHVLHHLKRHPELRLMDALRESGKAVALTTVTTVVAFASLVFAGHPALRSLGLLTGLGVALCLLSTLTVIPCAAPLFRHLRGSPE